MKALGKNPLQVCSSHDHYFSKPKNKLSAKNHLKFSVPATSLQKTEKITGYIPRKRSVESLKKEPISFKESQQEPKHSENQENTTKTVRKRNLKRWENEFKGFDIMNRKRREVKLTRSITQKEIKGERKEGKKKQAENEKQMHGVVLERTKTILKEYQKNLIISNNEKRKLFEENTKLKEIIQEYMGSKR